MRDVAYPPSCVRSFSRALHQCQVIVMSLMSIAPRSKRSFRARVAVRLVVMIVFTALAGLTGRGRVAFDGAYAPVGFQATRGYFSQMPFDRVDPVNGNLTLTFTDLVFPGNAGMDLRISRTYTHQRTSGSKWAFSAFTAPVAVEFPEGIPRLLMGDGSTHMLHQGVVPGFWVTAEFWRYDAAARTVALPNGCVASYEANAEPAALLQIVDPFGNTLTPSWDTSVSWPYRLAAVVQAMQDWGSGRLVTFAYQGPNPRLPTAITFDGRTWSYAYEYTDQTTGTASLTQVSPPSGPGWTFGYTQTGSGMNGSLTVTLPTGGTVRYEFAERAGSPARSVVTALVTGGRAITGGTWTVAMLENAAP